jgi:hypothetical protein
MNLKLIKITAFLLIAGLWLGAKPLCAEVFFRDDFDINSGQWRSYNDNEVFLDVRDGKLIVESREQKVITSWNYIRRYQEGRYRVSAQITREKGPKINDGGLALKNQAGVECYLGILGDNRYVVTVYNPDEERNVLRSGANSHIKPRNNNLLIELEDNKIRFFVNGHLIEEVDRISLSNFWIGFRVGPRIRITVDYIELSFL